MLCRSRMGSGEKLYSTRPGRIQPAEDPYQSVDIRGTAELIEDRDKSLLRPLWQKYLGQGPPGEAGDVLRLIVRVTPLKVTGFSA